ncbi:MAG: DinB family protein [Gemmatimonadota bacterium]|nr:DinB family protein [Gemmatimonadota bacterium]
MPATIDRPEPDEYAPYFERYISKVPPGGTDILAQLARQIDDTASLFGALTDAQGDFRYGPDKWSVKQMAGHMADTERIFCYRAVCFARGETVELPGFDENTYAANAHSGSRKLADIVAEFRAVRAASVAFFSGLDAEELLRRGQANGRPYSVRAVPFIMAGHERHHCDILRERYLPAMPT